MMGCDIHMRVEYKYKGDSEWKSGEHYCKNKDGSYEVVPIYDERSYNLFSILAGVRNNSLEPIIPIMEWRKGFPSDACEETVTEYLSWDGDSHSTTWYSMSELEQYYRYCNKFNEETLSTLMVLLQKRKSDLRIYGGDQMRIVFWFDN